MLFRRDLWRSLVQLFAQSSSNFKVRSSCSSSYPAKLQKSLIEGGHTGSLENLLQRLIVLPVKTFFPCIQSKIPCCNFQLLSLVLPLCASWFCVALLYDPSSGEWHLDSPQPSLTAAPPFSLHPRWHPQLAEEHLSAHGARPRWRCQIFLALYQTLRNAFHSAVRFQAVHPNPLKLMVQPVFSHLVVHMSSPHLPSFGYTDVTLFCPFCAYKIFMRFCSTT